MSDIRETKIGNQTAGEHVRETTYGRQHAGDTEPPLLDAAKQIPALHYSLAADDPKQRI